jgi:hypothetical protein
MEPTDFEATRKRLWSEVVNLVDARAQYLILFGTSDERVKLLNVCAHWFFGLVQRVLLREIILGTSRLTDPLKSGKHSNLVLESLLLDSRLAERPDVREELRSKVRQAQKAAVAVRQHRHKYIAHLDHAVAIGESEAELPSIKRTDLDAAVDAIGSVYRYYSGEVLDVNAYLRLEPSGGADRLVDILESSQRWTKYLERTREGVR